MENAGPLREGGIFLNPAVHLEDGNWSYDFRLPDGVEGCVVVRGNWITAASRYDGGGSWIHDDE